MISRRQLLYFSALLAIFSPIATIRSFAVAGEKKGNRYPTTLEILKDAYWTEIIASEHYDGYCQKALAENFPNVAYLFFAFKKSERTHANNYQKIISSLESTIEQKNISVSIDDTKANLNNAAIKELEKIKEYYPEVLSGLSSESHDLAVINCMYSWKSHQQHEKMIRDIKKYSGFFFKYLVKRIEGMNPDYFLCEICGSIESKKPTIPCEICNYPTSHYHQIKRPILAAV